MDFHKIWYSSIFQQSIEKFQFSFKLDKITGTLHEDQYTIFTYLSVLLRMRNVSDESCKEYQDTHFVFNSFLSEILTVYELMWKKKNGRSGQAIVDNIKRRMRTACWIITTTDALPEYVILTAFPLRLWWHERASMLRRTYIAWLAMLNLELITAITRL